MTEKIAFKDVNSTILIKWRKYLNINRFGYLSDRVANFRCNFHINFSMKLSYWIALKKSINKEIIVLIGKLFSSENDKYKTDKLVFLRPPPPTLSWQQWDFCFMAIHKKWITKIGLGTPSKKKHVIFSDIFTIAFDPHPP